MTTGSHKSAAAGNAGVDPLSRRGRPITQLGRPKAGRGRGELGVASRATQVSGLRCGLGFS